MNPTIVSGGVMKNPTTRTERLTARVTPEQKALITRAAELRGISLTEFITNNLQEAAQRAVREYERMELDALEREVFITALLSPPEPNEYLRRAAARYQKLGCSRREARSPGRSQT